MDITGTGIFLSIVVICVTLAIIFHQPSLRVESLKNNGDVLDLERDLIAIKKDSSIFIYDTFTKEVVDTIK